MAPEWQTSALNSPAVELANGDKFWYLNGQELTEAEFAARTKTQNPKPKTKELTVAHIENLLGHKVKIVKG